MYQFPKVKCSRTLTGAENVSHIKIGKFLGLLFAGIDNILLNGLLARSHTCVHASKSSCPVDNIHVRVCVAYVHSWEAVHRGK